MRYRIASILMVLIATEIACAESSKGAPRKLTSVMKIAGGDEPGERLEITGTVYRSDGKTPAGGVVMYAYHTNAAGVYPGRGVLSGHGTLRGWLETDEKGRYAIATIRPGSYPTRGGPAHIHVTVTPPGLEEYWIDEFLFDDDPLLTKSHRARLRNVGGSGVVHLTRGADGIWRGRRDIVLPRP